MSNRPLNLTLVWCDATTTTAHIADERGVTLEMALAEARAWMADPIKARGRRPARVFVASDGDSAPLVFKPYYQFGKTHLVPEGATKPYRHVDGPVPGAENERRG